MNKQIALLALATIILAACSSSPKQQAGPAPIVDLASGPSRSVSSTAPRVSSTNAPENTGSGGGYLSGDGPDSDVPDNLDDTPDAVPKAEPLHRYANRPYMALGKNFTPLEATGTYRETGIASWYGKKFHGQKTSIGEVYDMYGMTAAHPILPIPSYARVTNLANNKSVIVRVNDRGPFLHDRIIDLSYTAAHKLGIIGKGSAKVEVESIAVDGSAPLTATKVVSAPITPEPIVPVVAVVATPKVEPASSAVAANKIYLQLGAFKTAQAAEKFLARMRAKLGAEDKSLAVFSRSGLERVYFGPFSTEDAARAASEKLKGRLGFKPYLIVH